MTDRGIPFSAPMVRALLDGRKTQTRRVLKRQALHKPEPHSILYHEGNLICRWQSGVRHDVPSPYAPGDRLWVREAWRFCAQMDFFRPSAMSRHEPRIYEADGALIEPAAMMLTPGRYRHARFMPRWASRLTLIVTDVRVQRLCEISEADAVAEGIEADEFGAWHCYQAEPKGQTFWACPRESFRTLWNSLHGPDAWGANPWVVAVSFTVQRGNIDQIGGAA
jgi:hypothetical protein